MQSTSSGELNLTLPITYTGEWVLSRQANKYTTGTGAEAQANLHAEKHGLNKIHVYHRDTTPYMYITIGY